MINPYFMDPEDVARMCEKSKKIWGAKWRWKKEAWKHGYTAEELEEKLDNIIRRVEEVRKQYAGIRSSNKQLGNDKRGDAGNGGNEEEVSTVTEGDNSPVRVSGPIDGKEVRSRESENGTSTDGGTE